MDPIELIISIFRNMGHIREAKIPETNLSNHIVFVAATPAPPALSTHAVISSVMVELGDSLTNTGPE